MPIKTACVEDEYRKNKQLKKEDVEALQVWMAKQPHLPKVPELLVVLFLHSCYYKIEPTKAAIEAFFALKSHFKEVFENRDPSWPSTLSAMDCSAFIQLPQRTPKGHQVLFYTFMDPDPSKYIATDHMKLLDMFFRLWLQEDGTTEGIMVVLDVKHLTFMHLTKMTISSIRSFFAYLQEGLPVRLKGLILFNAGGAAQKLLAMCRPFIKAELNKILHLHADVSESLFNDVPKECLPKDYGGNADTVGNFHVAMKKKLLDNADFFLEDEKLLADESKRIDKSYCSSFTSYGVDGSFKKLEVD